VRGSFRALAAVATLAIFAGGCAGGGAGAPASIRLGYQTNVWGMPVYTAIKDGCFQKENLPLQEIQVDSGNRVRDLMVAEKADVGTFAGPTMNTGMDKSDIVAVGMVGTVAGTSAIVARADSNIRGLADLRGKKIAAQAGNSISDVATHQILPSAGLHEGDYQLVNIPVNNMVSALAQKQVDAMVNVEPYNAIAVAQGIGRRVVDYTNYDPMPVFIGMRQGFIDQHHQQAVQILRALLANAQKWQKDPEAVYKIIDQYYTSIGFKVAPDVIRDAASRMKVQVNYFDGIEQYMRKLAERQKQLGQIGDIPDYSKTLNTSLLAEASANNGAAATGCSSSP
jgi:ABC-type nitrate/sulfonate/bicarbonate transport system substrate-binding protein